MTVFVRAVELEGFSSAARDLRITPSAVSKIIGRLENRLGVRLLNRTTRRLSLTAEGESFFVRCQRILTEIDEAEAQVSRSGLRPQGLLRMNCGVSFGQHQLVGALPEFLKRFPEIRIELRLTDRLVNLLQDGADLTIRVGAFSDSSLVARKICDLERVICASPAYLKRCGTPRDPQDLRLHNCLYVTGTPALRCWPFKTANGPITVEVNGNVAADNGQAILGLAVNGVGIARLADLIVSKSIQQGRLVRLLTETHHAEPIPLYALFPQNRQRAPKLTAMLSFLIEKFSNAPWRDGLRQGNGRRRRSLEV